MNKELIVKYLNNQCSPAELEEVIRWVKDKQGSDNSKEEVIAYWKSASDDVDIDDQRISSIFDNILNQIESDNSRSRQMPNEKWSYSNVIRMISRVAVILLIPVLLIFSYTISEQNKLAENDIKNVVDSLEVIAPLGSRTVVQLSDNTVIHLNSGSKIKYPRIFSGDRREVILTGEAYFEVAHKPEKVFTVKTSELNITAFGTSFNVLAYSDSKFIETTLIEGKVGLMESASQKKMGMMVPGQHAKYNKKDGIIISSKGNIEKYISWMDGKIIFEDTPIEEVAARLSRMFNVDIIVSDAIKNYDYTVTFIDEPLYQILDLMALATPIKYTIEKREKNPDGTYSKQRIIIDKN